MAAPAALAVLIADMTRSSGHSSKIKPLVNTEAVDCSACTHHNTTRGQQVSCTLKVYSIRVVE